MSGAGSKAVIKNADMSEEMQADAIDCATQVRLQSWGEHGWAAWATKDSAAELPCEVARGKWPESLQPMHARW